MPADLFYFMESKLDRTNMENFYVSLPNHLQSKFKQCIHAKILSGNVLQGYRGPSKFCNNGSGDSQALESSNGIQEIKFWWGFTKCANFLPVVGSIAFLTLRIMQSADGDLNWSSLYFDSKTGECLSHNKEVAASKLNEIGRQLFENGKFSEAIEYFSNAHTHSRKKANYDVYKDYKDKAKAELDALSLNSQGDNLFYQGRYHEAHSKYQEAYTKSKVRTQYNKYSTNRDKAKAEIDAINLNSQGDNLFSQSRYHEAYNKYQESYDKSQITKEKKVYAINQKKTQNILNKLSELETSWKKAWDIESDPENDRYEEVAEMFQKILSEALDGLKIVPNEKEFKQYKDLTSLKIEGNELFNEGVELQQDGLELLQESHKLKRNQKYKLAISKFHEAKEKFSNAIENFKIGRELDQRFISCVELVQEQLNDVMESIKSTEHHTLASGLNIDMSIDLVTDALKTNFVGEQNCHAQI